MNTLLAYLLVVSLAVAVLAENCQFPNQEYPEDIQKQLQRLDPLRNRTFSTNSVVGGTLLTFKFRLCDMPTTTLCPPTKAAVIVEDKSCQGSIGLYSSAFISSGSNWVSMTFKDGDKNPVDNTSLPQESTITFVCDSKSKENFSLAYTSRANKQTHWIYSFVLNTDHLCDKPPVGGLSGGSVFCIIFFTVAGVYFLFGFLYRRFVVRAKGVEQIPNYDLWKEFGNLVADGCDYMCRCGTRQEAKMYQGIGDPLGNESETEERDDRLLPM